MDEKSIEKQVEELAEMLKKNGFAASMYEARERAKSIISANPEPAKEAKIQEAGESKEIPERFSKGDYDIQKEENSLDDLMRELGIDPEDAEIKEEPDSQNTAPENLSEDPVNKSKD